MAFWIASKMGPALIRRVQAWHVRIVSRAEHAQLVVSMAARQLGSVTAVKIWKHSVPCRGRPLHTAPILESSFPGKAEAGTTGANTGNIMLQLGSVAAVMLLKQRQTLPRGWAASYSSNNRLFMPLTACRRCNSGTSAEAKAKKGVCRCG